MMQSPRRRRLAGCGLLMLTASLIGSAMLPFSARYLSNLSGVGKSFRARCKGARFIGDDQVQLQRAYNHCGAAALQMILASHGIDRSVEELLQQLRMTPAGTSLLDLRLAATEAGVPARSWALSDSHLRQLPMPAIAFVGGNHFVVIRRMLDPRTLEVDDPAIGRLRWPIAAFCRYWKGETLVFSSGWTPMHSLPASRRNISSHTTNNKEEQCPPRLFRSP
jgi:predicted double-glycine peptidase